nr:hypothetical protein [Bdellovibrionales bacterium]
ASLADERGYQPLGEKIVNGDEARWSNIPWDDFTENEFAGRSYSAGAFVCNEIMYRLIEYAEPRGILSGFVHVPVLESQVGFSLGTKTMREDLAIRETERVLGFLAGL